MSKMQTISIPSPPWAVSSPSIYLCPSLALRVLIRPTLVRESLLAPTLVRESPLAPIRNPDQSALVLKSLPTQGLARIKNTVELIAMQA